MWGIEIWKKFQAYPVFWLILTTLGMEVESEISFRKDTFITSDEYSKKLTGYAGCILPQTWKYFDNS